MRTKFEHERKPWEDEFMLNLSGFAAHVQSNTQI